MNTPDKRMAPTVPGFEPEPEKFGFKVLGEAYMYRRPIHIKRTTANAHLFVYDQERRRYDVIYQSSSLIVDILEIAEIDRQKIESGEITRKGTQGHYALFDNEGRFYNNAKFTMLTSLHSGSGSPPEKHTAHFDILKINQDCSVTYEPLAIAIDDIRCISHSVPILTDRTL